MTPAEAGREAARELKRNGWRLSEEQIEIGARILATVHDEPLADTG